ncbi:MAG: hypothetical protein AAFU55_05300, partial [Pseudomonadota bacterium]
IPPFLFFPGGEGDPPELNGSLEGSEMLLFTFDQEVIFNSVSFGEVDGDDDFDLAIDGIFAFEDVTIAPFNNPFFFTSGERGTTIGIGADTFLGAITGGGDDFRVSSISVTAVPLPATGLLLFAGVGALALGGWRRRRAAEARA